MRECSVRAFFVLCVVLKGAVMVGVEVGDRIEMSKILEMLVYCHWGLKPILGYLLEGTSRGISILLTS